MDNLLVSECGEQFLFICTNSVLMESMRTADSTNWSLTRDQMLDLASSLSDFFTQRNVNIKTEFDNSLPLDYSNFQSGKPFTKLLSVLFCFG